MRERRRRDEYWLPRHFGCLTVCFQTPRRPAGVREALGAGGAGRVACPVRIAAGPLRQVSGTAAPKQSRRLEVEG